MFLNICATNCDTRSSEKLPNRRVIKSEVLHVINAYFVEKEAE